MPPKTATSGSSAPVPGFDAPLEVLADCHVRMLAQCSTLQRLAAHGAAPWADEAAQTAAHNVIRYFDGSGRYHHQDEEQDLFPALIESMAGSDPVCIRQLVDSLTREHREMELRWQTLKAWLAGIEAGDAVAPPQDEIDLFVDQYQRHIAREEQELLPMAARLLESSVLSRIGEAMRQRRGMRPR
ncbi:MAG: hemerythrin domain-containing protein [Burkholderiales bacterium]|nr:hemerythrin domain-containing protein [Burkholderiales bacterium]